MNGQIINNLVVLKSKSKVMSELIRSPLRLSFHLSTHLGKGDPCFRHAPFNDMLVCRVILHSVKNKISRHEAVLLKLQQVAGQYYK